MDTTLGKRIVAQRKKLGLTQDKLAETLGVTAQAVSKWENDQSCPDITMLPRLAELFGITTDELLGVAKVEQTPTIQEQPQEPVVPEGSVESHRFQKEKHGFEFQWEPGKRDAIFLSLFVLLVGALNLASVLLGLGVSFWSILWPCGILAVGVWGLLQQFSFFSVACTLFGVYFLLETMYITNWNVSWKLIFPILILLLGICLLVDAFKRPKHSQWNFHHGRSKNNAGSPKGTPKNDFSVDGDSFSCSLAFGDSHRSISMEKLTCGEVSCSFGELTLDLTDCEAFTENGHINASCSFGELVLVFPKHIRVAPNASTAFAGLDFDGEPDRDAKITFYLDASINFGEITIRYI